LFLSVASWLPDKIAKTHSPTSTLKEVHSEMKCKSQLRKVQGYMKVFPNVPCPDGVVWDCRIGSQESWVLALALSFTHCVMWTGPLPLWTYLLVCEEVGSVIIHKHEWRAFHR
jgi:hypothetical protein